jgi:uncharacterized protein YndB with AHSA1/START domain
MSGIGTAGQTLRLDRLIPMSPDRLFALWIEPEQLVHWWAPDGYKAVVDAFEVRPGGRWRIVLRGADGREAAMGGLFLVVESARQLAFSWAWEEGHAMHGSTTEVTVNFEPVPGGTRLVLVQQGFAGEDARGRHQSGWSASIDRIVSLGGNQR